MAIDWQATFGSGSSPGGGAPSGLGAGVAAPQGPSLGSIGKSIMGSGQQAAQSVYDAGGMPAFNQALGAYQTAATPDYLDLALQRAGTVRSGEYAGASIGLNKDAANLQYQSQLGDAQTNIGQNAIALAAAQRQPGVLDALDQIQQKMFGNQRQTAQEGARQDWQRMKGAATAAGTGISAGTRTGQGNIYANLMNQLGGIGLNNDQFNVNSAESKAQAQDRIKTLGLEASNLGMKPAQLESMLKNQLSQMGLDATKAYGDLLDGLASNDVNAMKLKEAILQKALAYSNGT